MGGRPPNVKENQSICLPLLNPSAQGAGGANLGEKSGGCHLLGNTRDLEESGFPGSFGVPLKLKKGG
jgi:hypothetical protein